MGSLSSLMLIFIVILLVFAVPKMYSDWLSLHKLEHADEFDTIQDMLVTAKSWTQRHFWCALLAICMAFAIDNSALEARDEYLVKMTTAYAALSIFLAVAEALFEQRITVLLSDKRVAIRSREKESR